MPNRETHSRERRSPERDDQDRGEMQDNEGGYGGGRVRAEEWPEHGFGERGWGGGRASRDYDHEPSPGSRDLPRGVRDVGPEDPRWQERYVRENASKYGQGGGKPIANRGPAQSGGGYSRGEGLGSTHDVSPRGTYGIRKTENWPEPEDRGHAGKGPKGFRRSDERISEDLCRKLTDHPDIDASEVEVQVRDGEVTFTGTVEDRRMKRLLEDTAYEVSGVREVHNQVRVGA